MFVPNDIPLYKNNTIMTKQGKTFHSSEISQMYKKFENLKSLEKNYIAEFCKEYDLNETSLKIFNENIITLNNDYKLHCFYESKKNGKVFIFFHGIFTTIFRKNLIGETPYSLRTYFKNDFDILIPEWPGTSINDYKNDKENFEQMIDVCAEWLKKKYQGKKIIIGGHSFGCWIALGLVKKLEDRDLTVILNNIFYDNQTAILWTLSPFHKKFLKSVTTRIYKNDELLQSVKHLHKKIFILAHPKDFVCSYEDAQKLKSQNPEIKLLDIFPDSRNFSYENHTKINFEENFWIAQNAVEGKYFLKEEDYTKFKKMLLKS
jgi:predicted esterase